MKTQDLIIAAAALIGLSILSKRAAAEISPALPGANGYAAATKEKLDTAISKLNIFDLSEQIATNLNPWNAQSLIEAQVKYMQNMAKKTINAEVGADRTAIKHTFEESVQQAQANAQQSAIDALPKSTQEQLKAAGITNIGIQGGGNLDQRLNIAVPKGFAPIVITRAQQAKSSVIRKSQAQQITRVDRSKYQNSISGAKK